MCKGVGLVPIYIRLGLENVRLLHFLQTCEDFEDWTTMIHLMRVTTLSSEVIRAPSSGQTNIKKLSVLDAIQPPDFSKYCFFFKEISPKSRTSVALLFRNSLLSILSSYPDFYGSLETKMDGLYHIADNKGVPFTVAEANFSLSDAEKKNFILANLPPDLFDDHRTSHTGTRSEYLLMVKLTFLQQAALVVSIVFNHCMLDADSTTRFMNDWSSLSTNGRARPTLKEVAYVVGDPSAFSPQPWEFKILDGKAVASSCGDIKATRITTSFDRIDTIRSNLQRFIGAEEHVEISRNDTLSAILWQSICRARNLDQHEEVALVTVVNGRRWLGLPNHYRGNCVFYSITRMSCEQLMQASLADIARRIRLDLVKTRHSHIYSTLNWLERIAMEGKIKDLKRNFDLRGSTLMITSAFPYYSVNFGTGDLVAVSVPENSPFVRVMPSPSKDGVCISFGLKAAHLESLIESGDLNILVS